MLRRLVGEERKLGLSSLGDGEPMELAEDRSDAGASVSGQVCSRVLGVLMLITIFG